MPKNFYQYCAQTEDNAVNALLEFLNNKEKIIKVNLAKEDWTGMFVYAKALLNEVTGTENEDMVRAKRFLRFLEPEILHGVINDSTNINLLNEAFKQILFLYFVIVESEAVEVYDPKDLVLIGLDMWSEYEGSSLVGTLGKISRGILPTTEYLPALKSFLPKDPIIFRRQMPWQIAVIMAVVFDILWNHYFVLADEFQALLLERFFYVGIVTGSPIWQLFSYYLENIQSIDKDNWKQHIQSLLQTNKEPVPMDVGGERTVLLLDIVRRYFAGLNGEDPAGFTHEEFLKKYYEAQPGRDIYRDWLRQAMKVYLFL